MADDRLSDDYTRRIMGRWGFECLDEMGARLQALRDDIEAGELLTASELDEWRELGVALMPPQCVRWDTSFGLTSCDFSHHSEVSF